MAIQRMLRNMRLSLARMPAVGYGKIPLTPAHILRDLWTGNSIYGMHLTKGEFIHKDQVIPLQPRTWGNPSVSDDALVEIYDFSWLRDLRELGTENARSTARALMVDWLSKTQAAQRKMAYRSDILGKRLTNWLGHYDFFAASADEDFKRHFMKRLMIEGRLLMAMLPPVASSYRAFSVLKGVMAVSLCLPEQFIVLNKITRFLKDVLANQILEDGVHIDRNAEIQLSVLRDLVEIKLMYQMIQQRPPNELISALDNLSKALRALRHGDGGLALFNGSNESDPQFIDLVLYHATQKRIAMTNMTKGGYVRCYTNRATLLVDSGTPADVGRRSKHAGCLSFEFSVGKQRLFVNCGAGETKMWQSVLGRTAAHTVLDLNGSDSVEFIDGKISADFEAIAKHHIEDGAHLLEMGHNGWLKRFGVIYQRKIYLSANGQVLKGEEQIDGPQQFPFLVRFHLHPSVTVEEEHIEFKKGKAEKIYALSAYTPHEGRQIWWFRFSGAQARIEESVYFGNGSRQASKQIVLYVTLPTAEELKKANIDKEKAKAKALSTNHPVKVDKPKTKPLPTPELEESSDYVAIFHRKDNDQGSGQESDAVLHPETVSEIIAPQGETEIEAKQTAATQNEHGVDLSAENEHLAVPEVMKTEATAVEIEHKPQVVQWGLSRKL